MNLNLGKFCLFFCCIVPIILPASSPKLENSPGFYPIQIPSPGRQNSRVNSPAHSPTPKTTRNLSDITSEELNAMLLQIKPQSPAQGDLQSISSSPHSKKSSRLKLSKTEIKELFKGYTPGKNRSGDTFSETSSVSAEVVKTSLSKEPKILTIPELIRSSAANRLKRLNEKEVAEKIKSHEANIKAMQRGRQFLTACAVTTPIFISSLLLKSEPQSRFGVAAAASILSMLPTIAGGLGTIFVFYKLDRALHYGADILRIDVEKWRSEDKDKIAKQFKAYGKMLDQEIADRIQGDKDIRKENLTVLNNEVSQLKTKFTQFSHNLEAAQIDVAHARNELTIITPQIHTAAQNSQDLKSFIATQIFPTVEKIQQQVAKMVAYNEQPTINPLADNIEFNNELNTVYISSDSEQEHKSHTPPAKMARRNALKLNNPKHQALPTSSEDYFGAHAQSFMDQFRKKKATPDSK